MAELTWEQIGLASNLARHLRAVNRVSQTEVDGHRFVYADLADIWVSGDQNHIVLTQHKDPYWLHWVNLPDGWRFVGAYKTDTEAENAAAEYSSGQFSERLEPGTYVLARHSPDARIIRVRCLTSYTSTEIAGVFERLGYENWTETLAS